MVVLLRYFRSIKSVVVNYDLFPEILAATGASGRGIPYKMILELFKWAYNKTDIIISLGEEMTENLQRKIHNPKTKISTIPNWADTENIYFSAKEKNEIIQRYDLQKRTVFSYAGTIGRCQGLEQLLDLIDTFDHNEGVHFLFFGKGVAEESFKKKISENRNKDLITYAGFISTTDRKDFINACDVAIISLLEGMTGLNFPSKTYNIMASGHPILFAGNEESELAGMIKEHDIGWVCSLSDPVRFSRIIYEAAGNPSEVRRKGERARIMAEKYFNKEIILNKYLEVFNENITHQTLG
jgi:glycosyltransferase involved in cell wall biosynthesis